ncbi:hypothetical protein CHCC15543_2977 [Bacillus licheniformis]|nr:hypothetical protein CHCC15543_2977 [Bacillus licheniformis]
MPEIAPPIKSALPILMNNIRKEPVFLANTTDSFKAAKEAKMAIAKEAA